MNFRKRVADSLFSLGYFALIAFTLLFLMIPVAVSIVLSFDDRSFIGPFPPTEFSLRWYREFVFDSYYMEGLKTSLVVSSVATAVSCVMGAMAAIALHGARWRGADLLQSMFISPLVIPTVVIGFGVLMFASRMGIVDGLTRLILGHIIIAFPYVLRAALATLSGIRPSYAEAAINLGATPMKTIWLITVPLAKAGIAAGGVFAFVMSFDEIAVSLFLSDPFTYTLPVALLSQMRSSLNLTVAAVSVIFIAVTIVLIWAMDRIFGIDRIFGRGLYR